MAIFDLSRALASQGKALGPHHALMNSGIPVETYESGSPRKGALISQREAERHGDAYGGIQAIDWVFDCINLYGDAAGAADYKLEKLDGTKLVRVKTPGTPPDYEVGPKALYDLLDQPNPFMLYDELISLLVVDLFAVGNGYWYKWQTGESGRPLALYRLAPSHVKIKPGPYGPLGYEYQPPGVKQKLVIDPADIIHFRRPNPHSQWYGMGVIQGAGRAMDLELAVTDTIASYFENKADPSLIIESERRVPRDVFHKLRAQLRARTAGSNKAGELLVLEAGLKANTLSVNASQAMFKDLSGMSQSRIYTKFRAHRALFGGDTTGTDKVADIRREFENSALRPFLKKLSTQISVSLAEAFDCKYIIDHRSMQPTEDVVKLIGAVAPLPGIKIREIRRLLEQFGIEESTGDPDVDNFILNKPGPEMDANGNVVDPITGKVVAGGDINAADQPIGSEPGRPPKAKNTKGFGTAEGKALDVDPLERLQETLEGLQAASEGKAVTTPAPDNRLPGEQRPSDPWSAARTNDIDGLTTQMQDKLVKAATTLERALLDEVEGKALKTSDIVSRVRNADAWRTFRKTVQDALRDGMMRSASTSVMQSGLQPDEDVDYEAVADEVLGRKGGLNSIVKTLKDKVVKRVRDARTSDAERHEFNAEIQAAINEWSTGSARTIAVTEAVHAYNEATLTVAELSGIEQVFVTDGDGDQPCNDADGQVWTLEKARDNRLEHPNCRRAFLPLTASAVAS